MVFCLFTLGYNFHRQNSFKWFTNSDQKRYRWKEVVHLFKTEDSFIRNVIRKNCNVIFNRNIKPANRVENRSFQISLYKIKRVVVAKWGPWKKFPKFHFNCFFYKNMDNYKNLGTRFILKHGQWSTFWWFQKYFV